MKTTSGRPAIHPGEFLAEILTELGVSQAAFARAVGISPMRISHVIKGARPVTAELALSFGKALGQSPEFWMNLQAAYDLATARRTISLKNIHAVAGIALAVLPAAALALAIISAAPAPALAEQQTRFYDARGNSIGTAAPQGDGSVRYYDSHGRSLGTSSTTGNTTRFYDAGGRPAGSFQFDGRMRRR
jgi:addiction module HigA family antidote